MVAITMLGTASPFPLAGPPKVHYSQGKGILFVEKNLYKKHSDAI